MTNVLVISSRDLEKGSTKFRIAQYEDYLAARGIRLQYIRRNAINTETIRNLSGYDLVFNQKCLINTALSRRIISNSKRTLFDFDDAIFTRPGRPYLWPTSFKVKRRLQLWLRRADVITTSSRYLADYAAQYSSRVIILPMTVDTELWHPATDRQRDETVIGWAGAPVNLPNLNRLEPVLRTILDKYPSVRLAVFSGKRPDLQCRYDYYPFEPGAEHGFIRNLDIGLLPLPDEPYTLGKSPIKAIQYLACGVPVIGEVHGGAPAEILNPDNSLAVCSQQDWVRALEQLILDREYRKALGAAGRKLVLETHSRHRVEQQVYRVIGEHSQQAVKSG